MYLQSTIVYKFTPRKFIILLHISYSTLDITEMLSEDTYQEKYTRRSLHKRNSLYH